MLNKLEPTLMSFCDLTQQTREGKINILGIFTQLLSTKLPIVLPSGDFIACLRGEPGKTYKLKLNWELDGKEIFNPVVLSTSCDNDGFVNITVKLVSQAFPRSGVYYFCIWDGTHKVGSIPLNVAHVKDREESKSTIVN